MLLLLINSCRKDQEQPNKVEEITSLKNWFQINKNQHPTNFINGLTPDWEHTYTSTTNGVLAVEVNLNKQSNIAFVQGGLNDSKKGTAALQTNIRLVLLKNIGTGAMDGCYMVVTGNSAEELGNLHYMEFNSLNGKVMYFDLRGSFVNGYTYVVGKVTNKLSIGNPADVSSQLQLNSDARKTSPSSGLNKKLMVVDVSSCNTQPVDVYVENCYTATPGTISDPTYNPVSTGKASPGKIMSGGNQTCVWVYSETIYQTTCEYTDPSEGGSGYGGSGGGSTSAAFNAEDPGYKYELLVIADGINLEKKFECFNNVPTNINTTYSIKICADIPVNNNVKALLDGNRSPGHTFIELTKTNGTTSVTETIGFYPESATKAAFQIDVNSMVVDNQFHDYDASLIMTVNANQFAQALATAKDKSTNDYSMINYNCTNFALDVFNSARASNNKLIVPNTVPQNTVFYTYGKTPNGLYSIIKDMVANGVGGASGTASSGAKSTICN